jgi:hypothetical protein
MHKALQAELGERAARAMLMESLGPPRRRAWWIVSEYVLARCAEAA